MVCFRILISVVGLFVITKAISSCSLFPMILRGSVRRSVGGQCFVEAQKKMYVQWGSSQGNVKFSGISFKAKRWYERQKK